MTDSIETLDQLDIMKNAPKSNNQGRLQSRNTSEVSVIAPPKGRPVKVEFACTANQGRSPVAQLIAEHYIDENDLNVEVTSSGTGVDGIKNRETPAHVKQRFIQDALNLYEQGELNEIFHNKGYLRAAYKVANVDNPKDAEELIDKLYYGSEQENGVQEVLVDNELQHRKHAIQHILQGEEGIEGEVKKYQNQTEADSSVDVFLAMAGKNRDDAAEIYQGLEEDDFDALNEVPKILAINEYVNGEEVADAFAQPEAKYETAVRQLIDMVPEAIDKAADEYSLQQRVQRAETAAKPTNPREVSYNFLNQ